MSRRDGDSDVSRRPIGGKGVLVTGGAGFIGSHLVDALIEAGAREVAVIDNLFLGDERNLEDALRTGKCTFYRDDAEIAASLEAIVAKHRIDAVFNCATKALNYSFVNPADAFATNVTVVLNLLELERKGAFASLCHFSTSEVYGTARYEPMDEAHPKEPTTTYAAGKAAADLAVESYVKMFGLDAYIVRPFNNYGPRQNYREPLAAVIPLTAWRILGGRSPEIQGEGTQSRDFIYVGDTVAAVLKLHEVTAPGESVNISSDGHVTIRDLIERICREMKYSGEVQRTPARAADVLCHNASNARLRSLIDFPLTPIDAGLAKTLAWYRELHQREPA